MHACVHLFNGQAAYCFTVGAQTPSCDMHIIIPSTQLGYVCTPGWGGAGVYAYTAHLHTLMTDSGSRNIRPSCQESDALTIRPPKPPNKLSFVFLKKTNTYRFRYIKDLCNSLSIDIFMYLHKTDDSNERFVL